MRRKVFWGLALVAALASLAIAGIATSATKTTKLDKVTLQLKWVTQAQFAGYYAAAAQGYYKANGLDVKLKVGGPDITPEQVVASGQAQFGLDWLPSLLAARDQGGEAGQHRPGLRPVRHDRADLEELRAHHDQVAGQARRSASGAAATSSSSTRR